MGLGMKQIVSHATRVTRDSETMIDLVITDNMNIESAIQKTPRISDHYIIDIDISQLLNCSIDKQAKFLMKGKIDYQKVAKVIQERLRNEDRSNLDCENKYCVLKQLLADSIQQGRKPNIWVKNKPCPWYSMEIKQHMVERDIAYNRFLLLKETGYGYFEAWEQYKQSRNKFISIWRNEKMKYHEQSFEKLKKDPKKLWKHLKTLYKAEPKQMNSIIIENEHVFDADEIANRLNQFLLVV